MNDFVGVGDSKETTSRVELFLQHCLATECALFLRQLVYWHDARLFPCVYGASPLSPLIASIVGNLRGENIIVDYHRHFVWYELMTTDMAAAKAFYASVVGWEAPDASTSDLTYSLFTSAESAVCGLIELPAEATKMGATPRWIGYVGVDDIDAAADRVKRLGGAVYVPPTETNIGRIAVVADPQTASFALIGGLKVEQRQAAVGPEKPGQVVWRELLAVDWQKAFAFYGALFGWQKAVAEISSADTYQLFSAGGQMIGGVFAKPPFMPDPFWVYYISIGDIDAAAARVTAAGGRIFVGPLELPDGSWIIRCADPQGAVFALQGKRDGVQHGSGSEFGWSTEWGAFSSKGRLVKPRS